MIKKFLTHLLLTVLFPLWLATATASETDTTGQIGNGGLLLVAASVNDHPFQGVVDTGASHHAYGRVLIPHLRHFESSDNDERMEVCGPQLLKVGRLRDTSAIRSAVVDLSQFSLAANFQADGIIGMPFLLGRIISVCPSRDRFVISENFEADTESIEIDLDEAGRPCVQIVVADKQVVALIDTGSNADVTVNPDDFRCIARYYSEKIDLTTIGVRNIQGKTQRRKIESGVVKVGAVVVQDVTFVESTSTKLGMAFLTRFNAVIDLKRMRLHLGPPLGEP